MTVEFPFIPSRRWDDVIAAKWCRLISERHRFELFLISSQIRIMNEASASVSVGGSYLNKQMTCHKLVYWLTELDYMQGNRHWYPGKVWLQKLGLCSWVYFYVECYPKCVLRRFLIHVLSRMCEICSEQQFGLNEISVIDISEADHSRRDFKSVTMTQRSRLIVNNIRIFIKCFQYTAISRWFSAIRVSCTAVLQTVGDMRLEIIAKTTDVLTPEMEMMLLRLIELSGNVENIRGVQWECLIVWSTDKTMKTTTDFWHLYDWMTSSQSRMLAATSRHIMFTCSTNVLSIYHLDKRTLFDISASVAT